MSAGASGARRPVGRVTVLGAHILDVLGRPVEAIPPGQRSARLQEIKATAAGTAAGTGVDLAKLGVAFAGRWWPPASARTRASPISGR